MSALGSFSTLSFEAQPLGMSPSPRKQTQDHAMLMSRRAISGHNHVGRTAR